MWPTLLLGLLVASVADGLLPLGFSYGGFEGWSALMKKFRSRKRLSSISLHGLGEASRKPIRPQELHRLIVEGATRVLDAHGGALYVTDRTGGKLTPAFISKGCPPLVDVPPNILQQAAAAPIALESFYGCIRSARVKGSLDRSGGRHGQSVCIA